MASEAARVVDVQQGCESGGPGLERGRSGQSEQARGIGQRCRGAGGVAKPGVQAREWVRRVVSGRQSDRGAICHGGLGLERNRATRRNKTRSGERRPERTRRDKRTTAVDATERKRATGRREGWRGGWRQGRGQTKLCELAGQLEKAVEGADKRWREGQKRLHSQGCRSVSAAWARTGRVEEG